MTKRHTPLRMCVICKRRVPKEALARYVRSIDDGVAIPDPAQTLPGRGWYLCPQPGCREKFRSFRLLARKRKGESA